MSETVAIIKENELLDGECIKVNGSNMKFDVIVGNPPYQQKDGGAQASAKPIYNEFVDIAKKLNHIYISMILPTRWFAGGKGLDDFRDQMLNDTHISELHDFLKPELLFKNINLRGGICYFLWDKNHDNTNASTKIHTYSDNLIPSIDNRSMRNEHSDIFIRHSPAVKILSKILSHSEFKSLKTYISSRKPFGLEGSIIKNTSLFRSTKKSLKNPLICYGKGKSIGYLETSEIKKNIEWIDQYKVYIPYANNIGTELNDDNLNAFVGNPKTICTETYLVIGAELPLDDKSSKNLCIYLRTRFARFMHSLAKISQHGTSKTYKFVPLQNFTSDSGIDWGKLPGEIDNQLYKRYSLTKKQIEFIESMIKPM